jgi:hypothetical protein
MSRVREEAPPVWSGEQLVARPGVSDHLSVRVERIPVHGGEDGVLAEVARVDEEDAYGSGRPDYASIKPRRIA